ncbi:MAG: ribulose-phosphate 3-epimerase, partial [Candidatus Omnitrophica bacterium]|nr:ribulose-phosphate 3-epimerase [Candidatus Omnitrophota bacterium]
MIIPALLTSKRKELIKMINTCAEFTDYVQIDIMDGEFVPS